MADPVLAFERFPVPAARKMTIKDSFSRVYIPGTNRKYERAKTCCLPGCAGHGGVDLAPGLTGKQAVAVWDGTVRLMGSQGAYGNHVTVQRKGYRQGAFYAHLDRFYRGLKDGQRVEAGDVLGYVGGTGQTFGDHLHFEVRTDYRNWCSSRDPYRRLVQVQKAELG